MNDDILKGKWKEMKGSVKKQWAKLTDDDLLHINGSAEELSGKLQKTYGYKKEEAKKQIDDFINNYPDDE